MRKVVLFSISLLAISCAKKKEATTQAEAHLDPERHITILSTNDIHGGVEPTLGRDNRYSGGMALWSGVAQAIREGVEKKYPGKSGVVTVDGGDQFQGTLLSNYDEGELVFKTMNEAGYDAVVPGNHDYDFGPIGWEVDAAETPEQRREALEKIVKIAKFKLISANTFFTDTIKDKSGNKIEVSHKKCAPKKAVVIDWSKAESPKFLVPYVIKEVAGVKVALIGIDHHGTPETTTAANVSDLCFGDEYEHYVRIRESLEGKADLFILVMHNGNANSEKGASTLLEKLSKKPNYVHAVVSAHTHFTYNEKVANIPIIQSGFGGTSFGRLDFTLKYDDKKKTYGVQSVKSYAGVRLFKDDCDKWGKDFCSVGSDKTVSYDGVVVKQDPEVLKLVEDARKIIHPIASQRMGKVLKELTRDRINESSLANAMTDVFREATGADVAILNTGGLRDNLRAGEFTYEDLFRVFPFSNRAWIIGPMPAKNAVELMEASAKTCGVYGALMQSGLKVSYKRDCKDAIKNNGVDPNAKLVKVETLKGDVLYDADKGGLQKDAPAILKVATLDFLALGGEKYDGFEGVPVIDKLKKIMRDVLRDEYVKHQAMLNGMVDDRFKNLTPQPDTSKDQ